jgi:hypothetical protein
MKLIILSLTALSLLLAAAVPARAEHFEIDITVTTPRGQAESHWDTTPPIGGVNPRPVVSAKVGDPVKIEWLMRSVYPHGTLKNVGVHFFVARERAVGQKAVPDLKSMPDVKSGKWLDSRLVMDFLSDHAARGSVQLTARAPGIYLIRVESENTDQIQGHEHFSAIDLKVER